KRGAGRTAQHDLGVATLDQVGDVRVSVADRVRLDLALAKAVGVEKALQGVQHEQGRTAVALGVRRRLHNVVRRDWSAHRAERYKDRNLLCAHVSQATMLKTPKLPLTLLLCAVFLGTLGAGQALASHN